MTDTRESCRYVAGGSCSVVTMGTKQLIIAMTLLASTGAASQMVCSNQHLDLDVVRTVLVCLGMDGLEFRLLEPPMTPAEPEAALKNLCVNRGPIRECLGAAGWNHTDHRAHGILSDLVETTLDAVCVQETVVITAMRATQLNSFTSDPLQDCITTAMASLISLGGGGLETSSVFYALYRRAVNTRACLADIPHSTLAVGIRSILSEVVDKMKCVDQSDGSTVLCTTIHARMSVAPRLCPVRTVDPESCPLARAVSEHNWQCIYSTVFDSYRRPAPVETLEASRAYAAHYCSKLPTLGRCWADALSLSSVCLNVTEHEAVRIAVELLRRAFWFACVEQNHRLALRLFPGWEDPGFLREPFRLSVDECLAVLGEEPNRKADYHRQLGVLRGCLMVKLRGDNKAVYYAHTVLTALQVDGGAVTADPTALTALQVDGGAVTANPTALTECPYVCQERSSMFAMFLSQSLSCLGFGGVYLDRIEDFRETCQRRGYVAHCLGELTAPSQACQTRSNHQTTLILTDFLHEATRIACRLDGQALRVFLRLYSDQSHRRLDCLRRAWSGMEQAMVIGDSERTKRAGVYRAFRSAKECPEVNSAISSFITDMLASWRCVHPHMSRYVLCQTIVNI